MSLSRVKMRRFLRRGNHTASEQVADWGRREDVHRRVVLKDHQSMHSF